MYVYVNICYVYLYVCIVHTMFPYFAVGMYVYMYVCDVNVVKFKECNCKSVSQCMMSCFSTLIVLELLYL